MSVDTEQPKETEEKEEEKPPEWKPPLQNFGPAE